MDISFGSVQLSNTFDLNDIKFLRGTPYNLITEPVLWATNNALWANKTSNIPIYKVMVSYDSVFEPFVFYYLRDETFYTTLENAFDEVNEISIVGIAPEDILIKFVYQTLVPKLARFNGNEDTILLAPPVYDYDYGPSPAFTFKNCPA